MGKLLKTAKDGRQLYRENGKFVWKKPGAEAGTENRTETGDETGSGSGSGVVREMGAAAQRPAFTVGKTYDAAGTAAEAGTETGTGAETKRKRRGRPRKTDAEKPGVSVKLDARLFATQLQGAHQLAALVLKNPGWALTDDEAQSLAVAMIDVSKQYDFNFNPKMIAWLKLATVSAMIYGPRVAFLMPKKKPKGQVLPFASPGNVGNGSQQVTPPTNPTNTMSDSDVVDIEWPPKTKLKLNT